MKTMKTEYAFPRWLAAYEQGKELQQGMNLRDYFAAKAMQSLILASLTNENAAGSILLNSKKRD